MGSKNEFLKELVELYPELNSFYESQQYLLSEKIINYMATNQLSDSQISKTLGIDSNYFNRLTSGDNTIEVAQYEYILSRLLYK